jgi:hypothetical protein
MPQAPSYQAQVDQNLGKISSHMTKWIQHSKKLICEEKPENEEEDTGEDELKRKNMVAEVSVENDSISLD